MEQFKVTSIDKDSREVSETVTSDLIEAVEEVVYQHSNNSQIKLETIITKEQKMEKLGTLKVWTVKEHEELMTALLSYSNKQAIAQRIWELSQMSRSGKYADIESSHGFFIIDNTTGEVLLRWEDKNCDLPKAISFDIAKHKEMGIHPTNHYDILELGYTTEDGAYVEPNTWFIDEVIFGNDGFKDGMRKEYESTTNKPKAGELVNLKCGHQARYIDDCIYAIATEDGKDFWGDICEDCFLNGAIDIEPNNTEHNFSDWKIKSQETKSMNLQDILNYMNESHITDINEGIADYFDIDNRTSPMTDDEIEWIKNNLDLDTQHKILGIVV